MHTIGMPTGEEIGRVRDWCEKLKRERGRTPVIERNPFRDEIEWTRRFPLVEIDRTKETAAKTSLVYDSATRTLWEFLNGDWRRVEPDLRIER
jgi:hypothetical protein